MGLRSLATWHHDQRYKHPIDISTLHKTVCKTYNQTSHTHLHIHCPRLTHTPTYTLTPAHTYYTRPDINPLREVNIRAIDIYSMGNRHIAWGIDMGHRDIPCHCLSMSFNFPPVPNFIKVPRTPHYRQIKITDADADPNETQNSH